MKKMFFLSVGYFFLGMGILGIFLPVLPTTPFLLLSSACFFRASNKLYYWITNHKIFGEYIKNYRKFRAIPIRVKVFSILLLWGMMIITILFFIDLILVKFLLFIIAIVVTIYILRIKTLTKELLILNEVSNDENNC